MKKLKWIMMLGIVLSVGTLASIPSHAAPQQTVKLQAAQIQSAVSLLLQDDDKPVIYHIFLPRVQW